MAEPEPRAKHLVGPDIEHEVWDTLGLHPTAELQAGHQSRVFLATDSAGPLVVKLIHPHDAGPVVHERAEITWQLAAVNPGVVGPVALGSALVNDVNGWQVICYPHVEGRTPDADDQADVEAMAMALVALHRTMRSMDPTALPPVAALRDADIGPVSGQQIIHGDYAAANVIVTPAGLRIIDFDDCGTGSVEFELGNSLYMVLFDSWHAGVPDRYHRFRSWFIDTYRQGAPSPVDDERLDTAIGVRAEALGRWLDTPAEAPPGIRTADPAWRRHLQSFLDHVANR